jgi:hypothetical protein
MPPCWSTLYELSKLENDVLEDKIADGSISPKTQRKDVIALRMSGGSDTDSPSCDGKSAETTDGDAEPMDAGNGNADDAAESAKRRKAEYAAQEDDAATEQGDSGQDQHEGDDRHRSADGTDCERVVSSRTYLANILTGILRLILQTKSPAEQITAIAQFNKALDQANYDFNDVEVRISKCFPSDNPRTPARILANSDRSD